MQSGQAPKSLGRWWPYLLIGFLYLCTSPYHQGLNNPNEMVRVYMSAAWVDEGHFEINGIIRRWGMVDDKAIKDKKLYSSKAPLQSLLGIPAYQVSKPVLKLLGQPVSKRSQTWVMRVLASALFAILWSWVLLYWCQKRAIELGADSSTGTAMGLILALGTMHYAYALTFTGHALAALTAGGTYLGVIALLRHEPGSKKHLLYAGLTGFLAGATPFAEYPAALVALPALIGALLMVPGAKNKAQLIGVWALFGLPPFLFGLWSHAELWGSPFLTGYSFLENKGYVEVHGKGFFGVTAPKPEAFFGSLFSPGTGLFFFSPVLLIGFYTLVRRCFSGTKDSIQLSRSIAIIALVGFILEVLFISGHRGWRGGWTLGPRYIIPVVTLLGLWSVEALSQPKLRPWILALGAASILLSGPASALYPHLSDVYTNPLKSFLLPSYLRGEMSYGLANALGLKGQVANALHMLPLGLSTIYVAFAGFKPNKEKLIALVSSWIVLLVIVAVIPENDDRAARKENRRLWGFWEPRSMVTEQEKALQFRPGRLYSARSIYREVKVQRIDQKGQSHDCVKGPRGCNYGESPWQHFAPEFLKLDDRNQPVLFMHPIALQKVTAIVPMKPPAKTAILRYGLADESMASENQSPVVVTVHQSGKQLHQAKAGQDYGFHPLELSLTSTSAPISVSIETENDGARVFGFDLEFYK